MTNQHPITPPAELLDKWDNLPLSTQEIFVIVAQWGADQELEACIEWLTSAIAYNCSITSAALRTARRPKPPSKVAQAESLIERHEDGWMPSPSEWHLIREALAEGRRALEQLDD